MQTQRAPDGFKSTQGCFGLIRDEPGLRNNGVPLFGGSPLESARLLGFGRGLTQGIASW